MTWRQNSAIALIMGLMILASGASADQVIGVGGSGSASTGASTTTGIYWNSPYKDEGVNGHDMDKVLTAMLMAHAAVPDGSIGSASATWATDKAYFYTKGNPNQGWSLFTSVEGKVEATADKTSKNGVAISEASISAQSAADETARIDNDRQSLRGNAIINANTELTGTGSTYAKADGEAYFTGKYNFDVDTMQGYPGRDFDWSTTGFAKGVVELNGENSAGYLTGSGITGSSTIGSNANIWWGRDGLCRVDAETWEELDLYAKRDISTNGKSYVEGQVVNGREMAEALSDTYRVEREGPDLPGYQKWADVESTSDLNGYAQAFNRNDEANTYLLVNPSAIVADDENADAEAAMELSAYADAHRTVKGTGDMDKVAGEGYITSASWSAESLFTEKGRRENIRYGDVSGKTGGVPDGLAEPLPGVGVGAWLVNNHLQLSTALVELDQWADADAFAGDHLEQSFTMEQSGMKPTEIREDASGAYGSILDQNLNIVDGIDMLNGRSQRGDADKAWNIAIAEQSGINWLEGRNYAAFPGWYTFSTPSVEIYPVWSGVLSSEGPQVSTSTSGLGREAKLFASNEIIETEIA